MQLEIQKLLFDIKTSIDSNFPIEDARKIVDLRNWVIHGYDRIDDVIIWGIISKQLPILQKLVETLLQDK